MSTIFEKMEYCAANALSEDEDSFARTLALLKDENWRVRYAAAVALGDRRDPGAVDALVETLHLEGNAPLFSQPKLEGSLPARSNMPYEIAFPEGTTEAMKEAWRRRGRVAQAAFLALGNIGVATPAILELLHDYALDQSRDYIVRAAACKALGQLALPESLEIVEKATRDEEWCTACEARKALRNISEKIK
jgi:hypothetical protein